MSQSERPSTGSAWSLAPLTPEYLPDEHHGYVTAIEAALGRVAKGFGDVDARVWGHVA